MSKPRFRPQENLGFLLAKASQRWNELLYQRFCAAGFQDVSPSYGSILIPLFEEDGLLMGELGRRARLSKQAMTTLIGVMQKRGLIARKPDPRDGRAVRIYLTPRSRGFKKVVRDVLHDMDRVVRKNLSPNESRNLKMALSALMNAS